MKIDLFGGTGFIGSNFKRLYPDTVVHDRDDNNPISDCVLYMISTTHNYHVFSDIHKDVDTNLTKLLSVLENCKDRGITFNFISSWFVYGDSILPAREDYQCNPKGFYSITKKCAEDLIISYCKTFNINYRILRLCNVYGASDKSVSKQKNAMQFLLNNIKNGKDVELYDAGDTVRDYLHVNDVCEAIMLCISRSERNQIINIGSGVGERLKDIVKFAASYTNSSSKIIDVKPTPFHEIVQCKNMYLEVSKLKSLGFVPKVTLQEGVRDLLDS